MGDRIKQLIKAPAAQYIFYKFKDGKSWRQRIHYWAIVEFEEEDRILPIVMGDGGGELIWEEVETNEGFDRIDFHYELE